MLIVLARHGQTASNAENRFQGVLNISLNERGYRQAKQLAPLIARFKPEKLYTSDLVRSIETAKPAAELLQIQPIANPIFREYSWGVLEGLTWAEAGKRYPALFSGPQQNLRSLQIPQQEPLDQFHQRVKRGLSLLMAENTLRAVALVGHGRYLNALVVEFLGLDFNGPWPFSFASAAVCVLEVKKGRHRLLCFNEECHLQGGSDD